MNKILNIKTLLHGAPAPETKKAYDGDIKYFWAWVKIAFNSGPSYPIDSDIIKAFVEQHVIGLQPNIEKELIASGAKKFSGRQKISTLRRRLSGIIKMNTLSGYHTENFRTPYLKKLLLAAQRNETQSGITTRQVKAITRKELNKILKTFKGKQSINDIRDQAMLVFGFYTGGRRGSEIVNAKFQNIYPYQHGYRYNLASSKTDQTGKGSEKILRNPHAEYITRWVKAAVIIDGYLFRAISSGGIVKDSKFSDRLLRNIIKDRIAMIGLNPENYSNHSLRRGFLTQCGIDGFSLSDGMQLSGHKDVTTALKYFEQGRMELNKATKMNTKKH